MSRDMIRCANCGTTWVPQPTAFGHQLDTICPVCQMKLAETSSTTPRVETITDLEERLDSLVRGAWEAGIDTESIVHVLRDELAFAAEMGNAGRRFAVQLIDLGPQEHELQQAMGSQRDVIAYRRGNA